MRIGVLSDTHIPDRAKALPEALLNDFRKVAMIIHSGDLADSTVLTQLAQVCPNVHAVQGNMDTEALKAKLPLSEIITVDKIRIGVAHGYGPAHRIMETVRKIFQEDNVQVIVFGHSHAPLNQMRDGILYFNPGSPTDTIFAPYNSYGILEVSGDKVEGTLIRL